MLGSMQNFSFVRRISRLTTMIDTCINGVAVGQDALGNRYYHERSTPKGQRQRRWVIYSGEPEASKVPADWHLWLHHTAESPIPAESPLHKSWEKPHLANQTGTQSAYFPPGHALAGGTRSKATGDYQAWKPE